MVFLVIAATNLSEMMFVGVKPSIFLTAVNAINKFFNETIHLSIKYLHHEKMIVFSQLFYTR